MSKTSSKILIVFFSLFLLVFSLLFVIMPDREFSEQENRYLTSLPPFSFSSLFSGSFTKDFESYMSDQFPFRDRWITCKAALELGSGKTQNNGVYYATDGCLIEEFEEPDAQLLESNLAAVNALVDNTDCEVYFQLVPTASQTWRYKLPDHAPSIDQNALIEHCYASVTAKPVDVASVLEAHADEYIYYRTDHHWTTLGAYYGYTALADAMGLTASPLSSFTPVTVSDAFCGTTYSSSGFTWVKPDRIEIFVPEDESIVVTNYPYGSPVDGDLYDESFLEKKDMYAMFYGGNTPLLHIATGNADKPVLLILRDSYADCFSPFLFDDFSEIYQLDLRYYKTSLAQFIDEHDIDSILLCYSTKDFATDNSLFLLGR